MSHLRISAVPTSRRLSVLASLALSAGALSAGLVSPAHADPSTLIVDDNMACAGAQYSTISSAVAAAAPGDTIKVCAGLYPETVNVDKPLTFLGAKTGVDGRAKSRLKLAKESVVVSLTGDFVIGGGVDGVMIDGFTLQGAGSDTETADAIEAFGGGSGYTFTDNVIRDNELGINVQNPDATMPTEISRNAFIDNSIGTTGDGGTGVFISNGPADSTTIEANSFTGDREAAINFAGTTGNPSRGLVVADNTSKHDSTFVVATNSVNALIDNNKITYAGSDNGTGILDFGANTALRITGNKITGGDGAGTSGIRVGNFSGAPSVGTTISGNKVTGRYNGIRVTGGYTDLYVAGNTVSSSASVGILVETGDTGNLFVRNRISSSAVHDCEDDTTGGQTAGTGNTWRYDSGTSANSTPADICT
jgi:hypothetical protein